MTLPNIQWRPPLLYFMHIPKTAGRSLASWLSAIYGQSQFRRIHIRALHAIDPQQLRRYRCWQSHCGPGLLPFLPQANLHVITLLRDPVEQMISYIYFTRKTLVTDPGKFDPLYLQEMQSMIDADLGDWLAHPHSAFFDNFQTRNLGITQNLAPWFKTGEFGRLRQNTPFPGLPSSLTDQDMSQVFARACQQVEQMDVVGITERFAASIEMISALLGVPMPKQLPVENIGSEKSSVQIDAYRKQTPPSLVEVIEARNRYDRELYHYGCELFAQQMARHRAQPKRTYSIAPRLRGAIKSWLPVLYPQRKIQ